MSKRAANFFKLADELPLAAFDVLVGDGGLVVVAPHPDDESLGCGGLLAMATAARRQCRVVVVTDGAASHPNSPSWSGARLRALREREAIAAGEELGLCASNFVMLGLSDGEGDKWRDDRSATAALADAIEDVAATAVFVTWEHDPHCDHRAAARLCDAAARGRARLARWRYPVWGHTAQAAPRQTPAGLRLDISAFLSRKAAAVARHRSQTTDMIDDDPQGFRLSPDMLARFARPFEIFLKPSE